MATPMAVAMKSGSTATFRRPFVLYASSGIASQWSRSRLLANRLRSTIKTRWGDLIKDRPRVRLRWATRISEEPKINLRRLLRCVCRVTLLLRMGPERCSFQPTLLWRRFPRRRGQIQDRRPIQGRIRVWGRERVQARFQGRVPGRFRGRDRVQIQSRPCNSVRRVNS